MIPNSGKLQVTLPTDRTIQLVRVFDAPRDLVFAAMTQPALMQRWLGVFAGWTLPVCEFDARPGGAFRYVWRGPDGTEMGYRGKLREFVPPERFVGEGDFDQSWHSGNEVSTTVLTESNGRTTMTQTVEYDSQATRDMVLQTPMKDGMGAGFDTLDTVLADVRAKARAAR
jgi:uncharacterized protein YndB with AHSA1/START domain